MQLKTSCSYFHQVQAWVKKTHKHPYFSAHAAFNTFTQTEAENEMNTLRKAEISSPQSSCSQSQPMVEDDHRPHGSSHICQLHSQEENPPSGFPRYLPVVEICRCLQGSFDFFSFKKKKQRIPERVTLNTNTQSSSSSNCSTPRVSVSLSHCCASNLTDLGLSYRECVIWTSCQISNYQRN